MAAETLTLDELLTFLKATISAGARICPGLRYDFYEQRDRYAVLLFYAILDHARSIAVLADARAYSAIPVVTRSALDAYADIANLADHSRYYEHLEEADAAKWKPILERASRGGNPALRSLAESDLLGPGRKKFAQELKELRARGVNSLGVEERFQRAGLNNEYESMYSLLSAEVHNNLSSLQSRYIDWNDERAWVIEQGTSSEHAHHYERPCVLTMGEIVIHSAEKLLKLFGHGSAMLSDVNVELARIWSLAAAEDVDVTT
jgi:hypothetical protein